MSVVTMLGTIHFRRAAATPGQTRDSSVAGHSSTIEPRDDFAAKADVAAVFYPRRASYGWSNGRAGLFRGNLRYTASRSRDLDRRDQRLARGLGATAGVERGVPVLGEEELTVESQMVAATAA
ncbi:hypothetical protein BDV96DRAFT_651913 [Lophiotrema nucula]|uniref:Uncharacterized protein n=1 Tax=Lophiotrema nucula TaxID=690887 RepID=A0A6A5YR34_9PLEO|nr:hypothetical protein BDV96DRAFT_651913 [Lophiotrema nucula]